MSRVSTEKCTLSQLYKTVESRKVENQGQKALAVTLQILSSQLAKSSDVQRESNDAESIEKLSIWISKAILPDKCCISYDDPLEDKQPASRLKALTLTQQKASDGLKSLLALTSLTTMAHAPNPSVIISVIALSNPLDVWNTPEIRAIATDVGAVYEDQIKDSSFITTHLLQNFIRPLFLNSKKIESITASGRKAMPTSAPSKQFGVADLEHKNQPWRYEVVYAITVFEWAVTNIDPTALRESLPLFLPPLLHFLDTTSTTLRRRGLLLLPTFFNKLSSSLLTTTGLGSVFEDAIHPTLLSVPSLTPTIEAEVLVPAAYEALFALCDVWYGGDAVQTSNNTPTAVPSKSRDLQPRGATSTREREAAEGEKRENQRIAFLTRLFRKGILPAHHYTHPTYPSITTVLLSQLTILITRLGIHTVKHLKDIMPLITDALVDPFAMARPGLVLAALRCLREVLLNCWPRFAGQDGRLWRMEALRGIVGCWRSVEEHHHQEAEGTKGVEGTKTDVEIAEVKKEMSVVGKLLIKAVEAGDAESVSAFKADIRRLMDVEEGIGDTFGIEEE